MLKLYRYGCRAPTEANTLTIHNIRLGFATNSSSTHSLIFLTDWIGRDRDVEGAEFGWDHFVAASPKAKTDYLALTLHRNLAREIGSEAALQVVREWLGAELDKDTKGDPSGYVDHQSEMALPGDRAGKGIDREFFEDLRAFLLQDGLVILGGNDNDGESHPLDDGTSFRLKLDREGSYRQHLARKDRKYGYWTIFNRENGTKLRLSFADPRTAIAPERASAPELVDVKITNRCGVGCSYCYAGSTPDGAEASYEKVAALAGALGELGTFEVAIGGGEPTLHPDFLRILTAFRSHGVVPNFTTRSLAWLRDPRAILDQAGGFAYSVETAADVAALAEALDRHGVPRASASVQYIMGNGHKNFRGILVEAARRGLRLTLLGYKRTGRGLHVEPEDCSGWVDAIKATLVADALALDGEPLGSRLGGRFRIGVDTLLARDYRQQIIAAGVHPSVFETREGTFSMFVDAVENKFGPSSYCDEREHVGVPDAAFGDPSEIRRVFESF